MGNRGLYRQFQSQITAIGQSRSSFRLPSEDQAYNYRSALRPVLPHRPGPIIDPLLLVLRIFIRLVSLRVRPLAIQRELYLVRVAIVARQAPV